MRIQDKRQPAFGDLDVMQFGKHKGELLQDVPPHYFRWLWTEGGMKEYSKDVTLSNQHATKPYILEKIRLANYIWNSREALEQELGDTFI